MRAMHLTFIVSLGLAGCANHPTPARRSSATPPAPVAAPAPRPPARVEVVNEKPPNAPRTIAVPPGHHPEPGLCRVWYAGRPAGQQPPEAPCDALIGRVPAGTFVLYNARAWDTDFDWRGHAKEHPGTVPNIVLRLVAR